MNPGWLDSRAMGSPRFPIPSFNLTLPWRLNPEVFAFLELFSPAFREGGSAALILPHRKVQGTSPCSVSVSCLSAAPSCPSYSILWPPMKAESEPTLPLGSQCLPWEPLLGGVSVSHSRVSPLPPPSRGGEPRAAQRPGGRGWTFGPFRLFPPSHQQLPCALGSFL